MEKQPIESLMSTTMENIRDMVDVNTVIGDPVQTPDGSTVIPVSRVSFGFVSGGAEYGAGVSVSPMGFLVLNADGVRMLPAFSATPVDRLVDLAPQLARELRDYLERKNTP